MIQRRILLAAVAAFSVATPLAAEDTAKLKVVATFSILGDMVARVGGDHVEVTTLVGPNGDTHVYQPTPADARALSGADVLVVNGLEFEGWLDRLVDASAYSGPRVEATQGVDAIAYDEDGHDDHGDHEEQGDHDDHGDHEDHGDHDTHADHDDHGDEDHAAHKHDDDHDDHAGHEDHKDHDDHAGHDHHDHGAFDPHAWQSLTAAVIYVDNITAALAKAAPNHAADFYANRAAYVAEIEALDAEIKSMVEALPADARIVVTSHDAFQYLGRAYGLTFLAPQGLSTESEASAKEVAALITQIREKSVSAVFVENISDARLIQQIANETGATVGGTLYPGALSEPGGPASTYLDMMRHNAVTITSALGS